MIKIKKKIADQLGVEVGRYDTHTHVFEHKLIKKKNLRYKPSYDAKIETLIDHLNKNRIDKAFLIQPSFNKNNNDYIFQQLKKYKKRFYAVGVLHEKKPLKDFKKLLKNKFIGVRLNLFKKEVFKFNQEWGKVFKLMIANKMHLEIYIENNQLVSLINSLPGKLIKIIDHCGTIKKDSDLKWIDKINNPNNLFVKCTYPLRLKKNFKEGDRLMKKFVKSFSKKIGKDNILWGSDFPWTGYEKKIKNYSQVIKTIKNYI